MVIIFEIFAASLWQNLETRTPKEWQFLKIVGNIMRISYSNAALVGLESEYKHFENSSSILKFTCTKCKMCLLLDRVPLNSRRVGSGDFRLIAQNLGFFYDLNLKFLDLVSCDLQ